MEWAELSAPKPGWPDSVRSQEHPTECVALPAISDRNERMIWEEEPKVSHEPLPRSRGRVLGPEMAGSVSSPHPAMPHVKGHMDP